MLFSHQSIAPEAIDAALGKQTLLVYLTNAQQKPSAFATKLKTLSHPSMTTEHDYLKIHAGVTEKGAAFILTDWAAAGNHALERRWLLNKIRERLKSSYECQDLVVYLDEGWGSEDLTYAEDFYFANTDPLNLKSGYDNFRLWLHPKGQMATADKYREPRLQHLHDFRLWVSENPDEMTSIEMGNRLRDFAGKHQCGFEVFDCEKLQELEMNLLLAVGQASTRSPSRLIMLTHNLQKRDRAPTVLIGKGITFDTGGINLKPFEGFVNAMKNDMGGAALMSHLFMALVESGWDEPLVLMVPACENLIGEGAMKPGVVIQSHAGKKVIIEHTDAEGRLILADAISYACDRYKPKAVYTAATLTTAALRQFSHFYTATHFANEAQQRELQAAGQKWGEAFSCWTEFLPFAHGNKTLAADLTNMGRLPHHANIGGGSNVAAHFLKQFSSVPFVHFDIFATTWNWGGDYPGSTFGATGAPFNSLFSAFREKFLFL